MNKEKDRKPRQRLYLLLRFLVSFGAIGLILYLFREQLPNVLNILKQAAPLFFLFAVVVLFSGLLSTAVRLQIIFRVHGIRLLFRHAYYVNIIAIFFNNVLPSTVGGEMVRAYYLYKNTGGRMESFGGVLIDRLFGLITVVAIGLAALLVFGQAATPKILHSLMVLATVTVFALILLFNRKIMEIMGAARLPLVPLVLQEKLQEVYRAMHHYREHKGIIISCVALTVIGQVSYVFANYLLAESLGLPVPLSFFFFLVPILLLLGAAPSINGMGVREAVYLYYLSDYISSDKALALALFTTFFVVSVGIISGIVFAFKGGLPAGAEIVVPEER